MTRNFWDLVNKVIEEADILLEILDSRFPELTRNQEIEEKVHQAGKELILVMNKCDLVSQEYCEQWKRKLKNAIFVSSREHQGTKLLREAIHKRAKKEMVIVGVLGYPNVGKSSVINVLKGRASAKTSNISGFTRALQKVKITNRIMMLDTPGVIPYHEKDCAKHALIGAVSSEKLKDVEGAAMQLIETLAGKIEQYFGVSGSDSYEILCNIALKRKMLLKGGEPNTNLAARSVMKLWQEGEIKM